MCQDFGAPNAGKRQRAYNWQLRGNLQGYRSHLLGGRRNLHLHGYTEEVSPVSLKLLPGMNIEREVGCEVASSHHIPGGFLSGLFPLNSRIVCRNLYRLSKMGNNYNFILISILDR